MRYVFSVYLNFLPLYNEYDKISSQMGIANNESPKQKSI